MDGKCKFIEWKNFLMIMRLKRIRKWNIKTWTELLQSANK